MKEGLSREILIKAITDQVPHNLTKQGVAMKELKVVNGEDIEVTEVEAGNGDKCNLKNEMKKLLENYQHRILNFHINKEK